ncbi:MAG: hypothetical protein WCO51_00275 [bacterium]
MRLMLVLLAVLGVLLSVANALVVNTGNNYRYVVISGVPPHAFITRPISSVNDFVNHVKTTPDVMKRYQNYYHLSKNEILGYFSTLHVTKLRQGGEYLVYYSRKNNTVATCRMYMPAGTPVFAEMTGEPVIKMNCGNPIGVRDILPPTYKAPQVVVPISEISPQEISQEAPVIAADNMVLTEPPLVVESASAIPFIEGPASVIPILERSRSLLGLLPLLAVGGLKGHDDPVPEPSTISMLAVSFTLLGISRFRHKHK